MGTQKLLLPFAGRTVIGHIAAQVLASPVDRTIIVVGHDAAAIKSALVGQSVDFVPTPDTEGDLLSSVRCGLRAVPVEIDAVLVVLGDQPSITSELIRQLIEAGNAAGRSIIVPMHDGKTGHPLLFSTRYREEILTGYDDVGLRGLLQAHAGDRLDVPVASSSVLSDMDYPEDYRREVGAHLIPGPEGASRCR